MQVTIGNIFDSQAHTLVNTVNCVGIMGKGIAKNFKERYPAMYSDYRRRCTQGLVEPGRPYLYEDLLGTSIILFPTKQHWRSSSKIKYVEDGLDWFRANWRQLGIESVAFPPLGCGNGGLEWQDVGPLMYRKLVDLLLPITIYAPYGTPEHELSTDFLAQGASPKLTTGHQSTKFNETWNTILYVISQLSCNNYSLRVGRVAYQKICYVLNRCGIDLGFHFAEGAYGPYSDDAKQALRVMANNNMIQEEPCGRLLEIIVMPDYIPEIKMFTDKEADILASVVDLFARFRDADQVETAITALYAYDALSNSDTAPQRCESQNVIDYIYRWKPQWKSEEDKRIQLVRDLYYLNMLGWVDLPDAREPETDTER